MGNCTLLTEVRNPDEGTCTSLYPLDLVNPAATVVSTRCLNSMNTPSPRYAFWNCGERERLKDSDSLKAMC